MKTIFKNLVPGALFIREDAFGSKDVCMKLRSPSTCEWNSVYLEGNFAGGLCGTGDLAIVDDDVSSSSKYIHPGYVITPDARLKIILALGACINRMATIKQTDYALYLKSFNPQTYIKFTQEECLSLFNFKPPIKDVVDVLLGCINQGLLPPDWELEKVDTWTK